MILEKLKFNRFTRNFLKLFSATLLTQIVPLFLSPLLTRLYSPEEFGLYSLYIAIVSLLIVYATGRYEFAISTVKTQRESESLLQLVIALSFIISIILLFLVFFMGEYLVVIFGLKIRDYLYYIPLTIFSLGIMQGINYYLNKQKDFSSISKSKMIQSFSNGTSSVGFGYVGFQSQGLIWANIVGIVFANIYTMKRRDIWSVFNVRRYNFKEIYGSAIRHKNYPLWNSTSAFFDTLALQAPILILSKFFVDSIVGLYSLTVRVVALPITVISMAVAQVYLSELSEKENNGESIEGIVKKTTIILAVVGLLPVVILFIFGADLFGFIFGEQWREAGELARILSLAYYAKFIVSPLSMVFFVKKAIKELSKIQFIRACSTACTLIFAATYFDSLYIVVAIYSIHEIIFYLVYWLSIKKISKVKN
ncbi:MAG: oligosaccharide flippase family protein [Solibacillus sp.]